MNCILDNNSVAAFQGQDFLQSPFTHFGGPTFRIKNVPPEPKGERSEVIVSKPGNGRQDFFSFNLCFQSIKICTRGFSV